MNGKDRHPRTRKIEAPRKSSSRRLTPTAEQPPRPTRIRTAEVEITACDDEGVAYGPVTVPANAAFSFNTENLEKGDAERLPGGVGNGEGNWRLALRTRTDIVARAYV